MIKFWIFVWRFFTDPYFALNKTKIFLIKVKHEIVHYYQGTRQLVKNIMTSIEILSKHLINTKHTKLTLREKRHLRKTIFDLFRVIPMFVIVLTPFLEFFLPLFLKFFPNMLPSTFESKSKQIENLKKRFEIRLEMAEFLQKRLKEKAEKIQSQQGIDVPADFLVTLKRVHDGKHVSEDQLKRTSNLFKNEIALDHSRETLNRICGYMGMRATGSTEWLRNHMKSQFKELKQDDYKIAERGIEKMTTREMSEECCERGMAVYKLNRTDLHKYLSRWIYFSVHRDVPIPVLIYASCFTPAERIDSVAEAVKNSDETNVEKIEMISGIEDKSIKRVVETKRTEDLYKSDFVAEKEIELEEKQKENENKDTKELHEISEDLSAIIDENKSSMARQKEMTEELLEKTKEIDEKFSSLPLDQRRQLEKLENTIEEFAENAISDLETTEKQLRQSKEESNINQKKELSYPEARKVMVEELGIDEDKAEEFVEKLDTKKDGKIDLSELKEINKLTESRLERVETLDIEDDEKKK